MRYNPHNQFKGLFVPNFLLRRRELSSDAKVLYAHLSVLINDQEGIYINFDFLADEIGLHTHAVKDAFNNLQDYALVRVEEENQQLFCSFTYADMLYGTQKVGRKTNKMAETLLSIDDTQSFLNPDFEMLFSTYRLKNPKYCGNRRDAYTAYLNLGGRFDQNVLLKMAENYLSDTTVEYHVGLYKFIHDRIFLNYIPLTLIYIDEEENEIEGVYDPNKQILFTKDEQVIGMMNHARMIELLQLGRLKVFL